MQGDGHILVRSDPRTATVPESDALSINVRSFEVRAHRVLVSILEADVRLFEILLVVQHLESRISNALAAGRGYHSTAAQQIRKERRRLGHQLHTGVGQLLAAIRIQGEIVRKHVSDVAPEIDHALERIDSLATGALEEVRGISKDLYVSEWHALPLDAALRKLWLKSGISERFAASIHAPALPNEPPPAVKALLYRAAQEGISNLIRHANAKSAHLALTRAEGRIEISVRDDGAGFDTARLLEGTQQAGIGLRALREEAADLGGRLTICSGPRGTTLTLSLPSPDETPPRSA